MMIKVNTREGAQRVIDALNAIITEFKFARVSDLMDLVGQPHHYSDQSKGWHDLSMVKIVSHEFGIVGIEFPEPEPFIPNEVIRPRRIEIWIDTEGLSEFQFEMLRQSAEHACWNKLKCFSTKGFVQANEVPSSNVEPPRTTDPILWGDYTGDPARY